MDIAYGFHPTPFGECLIATTSKGICHLSFTNDHTNALLELEERWKNASLFPQQEQTLPLVQQIFSSQWNPKQPLSVHLKGTNFQLKVWQALLELPSGSLTHYQGLATHIDAPSASRAVGTAIGKNAIAYLIPCHRVIQKNGSFGNYRWLPERKAAMIGWESSQQT